MNPGQNYPIAEHSPLFWVLFLVGVIVLVVALTGVFLVAVSRACQSTRGDVAPEPAEGRLEPTVGTSRRHGALPAA